MKKFNEQNMKAIYSKNMDKVTIAYGSSRVMGVLRISEFYEIEGLNGMQIAELVFNDKKAEAIDIVKEHLAGA